MYMHADNSYMTKIARDVYDFIVKTCAEFDSELSICLCQTVKLGQTNAEQCDAAHVVKIRSYMLKITQPLPFPIHRV